MSLPELILIAVSLSMDAFAVSISKGLSLPYAGRRHMLAAGFYFGIFQAGMPILGYLVYGIFSAGDDFLCALDCLYSAVCYRQQYGIGIFS